MDEEIGCGLCTVYAVKRLYRRIVLVLAMLALAGAGCAVWHYLRGAGRIRDADERYASAERDFTERFDRLKSDLAVARANLTRADALNRAARASVDRITAELHGNVRSIQEAKRIIGSVRDAVKTLEDSLLDSAPDSRSP